MDDLRLGEIVAEYLDSLNDDRALVSDIVADMASDTDIHRWLVYAALDFDDIDGHGKLLAALRRIIFESPIKERALQWHHEQNQDEYR